tara:strand:+ start:1377 stop:1655 length:279 start_codon:yes stop_codon:yes gene_type:complete
MAISEKTDLVTPKYTRRQFPQLEESLKSFLEGEFQRLENILTAMSDAHIEATDQAPSNPRRGMVRFNVLPWNPLSNNSQGLVVYNGTAWVAV